MKKVRSLGILLCHLVSLTSKMDEGVLFSFGCCEGTVTGNIEGEKAYNQGAYAKYQQSTWKEHTFFSFAHLFCFFF